MCISYFGTFSMSTVSSKPYPKFGEAVQQLRVNAGIKTQNDLASLLEVTQQTVSRWEEGSSKPNKRKLLELATVLAVEISELENLDDQKSSVVATNFHQPFPLEVLGYKAFEDLCTFLLSEIYKDASVTPYGGPGSDQKGLDIIAKFRNGTIYTFQCKKHEQFGPAKVREAINHHTRPAQRKHILLSRVASPSTREEILKHSEWELWDKEDISRKIRKLPKSEQFRLVDMFFKGQRMPLLGENDAGPWMKVEDFFQVYLNSELAFNHLWPLIGREAELKEIEDYLGDKNKPIILISGSGGSGKSKLLYEALKSYKKNNPKIIIRLPSIAEEVSSKHLEDLGPDEKLIVVDDAHDRDELLTLIQFVINPNNKARLVLALRTYGIDRLKVEISRLLIQDSNIPHIKLGKFAQVNAEKLAKEVIEKYSGPIQMAGPISQYTGDCPLATVMAAQIISTEAVSLELVNSENKFRETILGRFNDVITGSLVSETERFKLSTLLNVLALIQPFNPDDSKLLKFIEESTNISISDSNRLIQGLIRGGVVFNRGIQYRISPDLLADFLIENSCVTPNRKSSGYAEQLFDSAPEFIKNNIFINLGKLDWRMNNGITAGSPLLDNLWSKLQQEGFGDQYLKSLYTIAYYQPERAIQFAEKNIRVGNISDNLTNLIRYAAFDIDYVTRACRCLWEIAISVSKSKALGSLKEICALEPNKPVIYNKYVVDFLISLMDEPESWIGPVYPYELLSTVLQTEGHTTSGNYREISFSPFYISPEAVSELRKQVIDKAIEYLNSPNIKIGILSAQFLHNALRYPMGLFGAVASEETKEAWTSEFVNTLEAIRSKVQIFEIHSLVWIELLHTISWHAQYAQDVTKNVARSIIALTPSSLEFKITSALVNGFDHWAMKEDLTDFSQKRAEWQIRLQQVANEANEQYSDINELFQILLKTLEILKSTKISKGSNILFFGILLGSRPELSIKFSEYIVNNSDTPIIDFLRVSLVCAYQFNRAQGREIAKKIIELDDTKLREQLAYCIGDIWDVNDPNSFEDKLLEMFLSSEDSLEVLITVEALGKVGLQNISRLLDLIKITNHLNNERIVDELIQIFCNPQGISIDELELKHITEILNKIKDVQNLDGYWIQDFLSKAWQKFPSEVLDFFKKRVEKCMTIKDYSFRPAYGPVVHSKLKFNESIRFDILIREVWAWMRSFSDEYGDFNYYSSQLFEMIFLPIEQNLLSFFREKINGDSLDITLIIDMLGNANDTFVFDNFDFVVELLQACKRNGKSLLERARSKLYSSTISGVREGIPGEPFPKDLENLSRSTEILNKISQVSPAYDLYEWIKKDALFNIDQANKERKLYEDE